MLRKKDFEKHEIEGLPDDRPNLIIYHNLPDIFGMNIDGAITNWAVRTDTYTVESLANYVESKGVGGIILSEEEYENLK